MTTSYKDKFFSKKSGWIWWGIIIFSLAYIIFFIITIRDRGFFEYVGIDYRLWYSTGMIIRNHNVSLIYDSTLQSQYQLPLYQEFRHISPSTMQFWPLPLPYLSFFALPMVGLTLFQPLTGYFLWTILNIFGTVLYLLYFVKNSNIKVSNEAIFFGLLSLPVFLNIFLGQINLLILISFGETVRLLRKNQPFLSGLWLALLLVKPQTLLLLVPALLLYKKWRLISGFAISGAIILGCSLFLSRVDGVKDLFNVIQSWSVVNMNVILGKSGITLDSLVANLNQILPRQISLGIQIIFLIFILFGVVQIWLPKYSPLDRDNIYATFLGTYAATCTISPHSNVHMAIPIILLGLLVYKRNKVFETLSLWWVVLPSIFFLLLTPFSSDFAHNTAGLVIMLGNIAFIFFIVIDRHNKRISMG